MDIQNDALENTSLLEELLDPNKVSFSHSSIYLFKFIC